MTTAGLSCALASVASRYRRVASGSFSIAVMAYLRVECLVHEIVEGPAKPWWIVLQAARQVLHHQDRDQFLPRIDREPRCSSAAPTELADGAGLPAACGIEHDVAAETESLRVAELIHRRRQMRKLVCEHELHCLAAENPHAVELTAIQ